MDAVSTWNIISIIAAVLILFQSVIYGYDTRTNYVEILEAYTLKEYITHSVPDSAISCAIECQTDHDDSGKCVAYQWDAKTGTCRTQQKLNVTSSDGNTVGVMSSALFTDCSEILNVHPTSLSGVYFILVGTQEIRPVWCDMDTDGGGWTVFLKRLDGSVDFYVDLAAYKHGFGNVSGEYWLGLEALHTLTSSKTYQLRVDISDWEGASVYTLYDSILVTDVSDHYTLSVGAFLGGVGGDGFAVNNGMQFSAMDADRDKWGAHCAQRFHGGFWYKACSRTNPTGKYYNGGSYNNQVPNGIQWRAWPAHDDRHYSMKTMELKIRPR